MKDELSCPICGTELCQQLLKHCKKNVYLGHHRFLPLDNPFRKNTSWFNRNEEWAGPSNIIEGKEIQIECSKIQNDFVASVGLKRRKKYSAKSNWKRRSIFFTYHIGRYD